MKIRSFEFNLRELAGSMGDFGTLFPLVVTVAVSLLSNMAVGFAAGLAAHYSLNFRDRQRNVRRE